MLAGLAIGRQETLQPCGRFDALSPRAGSARLPTDRGAQPRASRCLQCGFVAVNVNERVNRPPTVRVVALVEPSVNDLFVEQVVKMFEVRNVQGAHSLDGHTERFICPTSPAVLSYVLSRGS